MLEGRGWLSGSLRPAGVCIILFAALIPVGLAHAAQTVQATGRTWGG